MFSSREVTRTTIKVIFYWVVFQPVLGLNQWNTAFPIVFDWKILPQSVNCFTELSLDSELSECGLKRLIWPSKLKIKLFRRTLEQTANRKMLAECRAWRLNYDSAAKTIPAQKCKSYSYFIIYFTGTSAIGGIVLKIENQLVFLFWRKTLK